MARLMTLKTRWRGGEMERDVWSFGSWIKVAPSVVIPDFFMSPFQGFIFLTFFTRGAAPGYIDRAPLGLNSRSCPRHYGWLPVGAGIGAAPLVLWIAPLWG